MPEINPRIRELMAKNLPKLKAKQAEAKARKEERTQHGS